MDYQFPQQLFPTFYNSGPPDSVLKHCAGNWGCYDRVRPQVGHLTALLTNLNEVVNMTPNQIYEYTEATSDK